MKWKAYPEYKDSGVEWLGEIPQAWSARPVKHGYDVQLGKMLQNHPYSTVDRLVPYVKALHVLWGKVNVDVPPQMWASPSDIRQYGIEDRDLLVCEGGEVGRAGIVTTSPKECIIQNALHRVRPRDSANARFLMYALCTVASARWFDVLCNRATIAHFTREKFADLRIPLPSATQQRAIAQFLDREAERIDALIGKKKRQIELLQEKRATLISRAVTMGLNPNAKMKDPGIDWLGEIPSSWSTRPVKHGYDIQLGKMLQNHPSDSTDRSVPYVKALHVTWGRVNLHALPEMWAISSDISQYGIEEGDLLVCEGGDVGRAGIVEAPPDECIIQNALHRVRPIDSADVRYLRYVLSAVTSAGWFDVLCNRATIAHFTREKFADLKTPLPPSHQQKVIAGFLDRETGRIDALIKTVNGSINLLREYRSALISAAVTGKIDVREEVA